MANIEIFSGIVIFAYVVTVYCIRSFVPFIYKYGITINEYNIGKMEKLDFSNKIGQIFRKPNTQIKVFSNDEIFFIVEPYSIFERRIIPNLINKCIFEKGEYKILTQIPFSYLIFPLVFAIIFYFEKDFELIRFLGLIILAIFVFQYFYNNWKMKFMLNDIKEFINGIIL